ncbi:hypothetical protein ALC56_05208 [Trachymyrmex septentrionalis]|uniref:Uncharacterized protein n=1 Tax=Trachymyrmex septentrionalis TaxID=34720 RepID=A0A195FIN7_9HYME|nr:hypothetical protein ALC56_05208 [Trachymyrmex septentrionalis]
MRCSLTDLWISLLSARGWLRRLTRAASQAAGMEEGEKGGRQRMGGGGRRAISYGPVGIPAAPKSEAHTFIPAVLARSLSRHHERFPTSRRPTSKTANVFPPPARLYRAPRCRIMTLPEYARLRPTSTALGARYDKLQGYSYISVLHLYHGIVTNLEF